MDKLWLHTIDVAVCALLLRIVLGWLVTYRRLLWLLLSVIGLAIAVSLIYYFKLPFANILVAVLLAPILIIIILSFLPELSRVYQAASHGNLFGARGQVSREIIPILGDALSEMAEIRRGGLIVLPRGDSIDSLISGGEGVEAELNKTLLLSIFSTKSPRHDGAVVVNGNRIKRVGSVLPLASADGAGAELGTRHLAALGLSERCDADVLVVSEERGVVSHAREGKLSVIRPTTRDNIDRRLREILEILPGKSRTKNPLFLSIVLWITAGLLGAVGTYQVQAFKDRSADSPLITETIEASIRYTGMAENVFIHGETPPKTCLLYLSRPEDFNLPEKLSLDVDLAEYKPNNKKLEINLAPEMIANIPEGVKVSKIEPVALQLVLAEIRIERLKVRKPELTALASNLRINKVSIVPEVIVAEIKDLNYRKSSGVESFPIDLSEITQPGIYQLKTKLNIPSYIRVMGQGLNEQNGGIGVTIEISEKQ
ncbi:MAG: diadenylate cyclase [Verrucomicrobiota bacterium]